MAHTDPQSMPNCWISSLGTTHLDYWSKKLGDDIYLTLCPSLLLYGLTSSVQYQNKRAFATQKIYKFGHIADVMTEILKTLVGRRPIACASGTDLKRSKSGSEFIPGTNDLVMPSSAPLRQLFVRLSDSWFGTKRCCVVCLYLFDHRSSTSGTPL